MSDGVGIPDPTRPASYFQIADVAAALREPYRPAPALLESLIYPGKLHSLTGQPEAGKSTVCLHLAIKAMRLGHNVLFLDQEAGVDHVTDTLRCLGADPELVDKHLCYLGYPTVTWGRVDIAALHQLISWQRPKLAIWDSSAAFMAVAGVDENDTAAVTRFWNDVFGPIARTFGCALIVTDHEGKNTETSRYARGSAAKLASVDVAFKLTTLRIFNRHQDGLLALSVQKDRQGHLHRHFEVRVSHDPLSLTFRQTAKPQPAPSQGSGLAPAVQKILDVLSDTPASVPVLVDRIAEKFGHGLKHKTASDCLAELAAAGMCDRMDLGPGRGVLWVRAGTTLSESSPPGVASSDWTGP